MRRSIVIALAVLVVGGLAGGLGSVAGSAGETSPTMHRAMIVCPLRSSPAIIGCCGLIVAGTQPAFCCCCGVQPTPQAASPAFCCPPTAICARPLPTISSSPNPSTEGAAVTVSGMISTTGATGGTGVSGVSLWQELPGQRTYGQIANTTANAGGSYSFAIAAGAATTNRNWYVTNGSAQSVVDQQLVEAKVTATDAVSRGRVTVSGAVMPSRTGATVLIERRSGAQWNVVGRARIGRGSRYVAHVRLHGSGPATVRVEAPANRLNTQSFSPNLTVAHG